MVGLLRMRLTAGVCVLAAALLVGAGGAVAVGDPGSNGSAAHGDHETNASGQPQSTGGKKPKDEPGGTDTKDGSRGSGGQPDQQQSTAAKKPTDEPGGTDTKDGSRGSGRQPDEQQSTGGKKPNDEPGGTDTKDGTKDDSDGGATVSEPVDAVPDEVGPVSDRDATVSEPVDAVADEVGPVSDAVAPVPDLVGPGSDVRALVQTMLSSVAGAVPLTQLQSDLYSFLLGIAGVAPVSDISAWVQDTLSSVAGAVVVLAQLRSDLSSFLLGVAGAQPAVGGVGGSHHRRPSAAAGASRLALGLPFAGILSPPLSGASRLPVPGEATGVATLDVIALGRASAESGMAPLTAGAAFPIAAGASLRQVFGELLLPVSLWALAAGALPGVGGLVILFSTGARLGYRQAKAGFAVRTAGIASFARSGAVPLGVVRSAALVVIRPRALRVVRPGALSADHLLDRVA